VKFGLEQSVEGKGEIGFIAVGGAGSNILKYIGSKLPTNTCKVAVNNDKSSLNTFQSKILLEGYICGQKSATELMDKHWVELESMLCGLSTVCLLLGLGGRTGSWVGPTLLQKLKGVGKKVIVVAIEPFEFEDSGNKYGSKKRAEQSMQCLKDADALLLCSNQKFIQEVAVDASMGESFEYMNYQLFEVLQTLNSSTNIDHEWITLTFREGFK